MRLLFVHEDPSIRGGGEVVLAHLARLAATIARVDLAAVFGISDPIPSELKKWFNRITSLDFEMSVSVRTLPSFARNLQALRRLLTSAPPCGCIATGYASAFRAAIATSGSGVRLLWRCDFPVGVQSWRRRLKRSAGLRLLGLLGAVAVCPSRSIRDELEAFGYPARQLRLVRNGVDTELTDSFSMSSAEKQCFRSGHGIPAGDLVAVCVARIDPVKNHQVLIRAVARAADSGVRVILVCAGGVRPAHRPCAEDLRKLAEELEISDQVVWLGHSAQVSDWLAASDVAVLASRIEAAPLSLLEAAAAGLPLVATEVGGIPEVVIPARTGYLFSPDDAEKCAQALIRLAGNKVERRALGAEARRLVKLEFNVKDMDAQWIELIRGLVLTVNS